MAKQRDWRPGDGAEQMDPSPAAQQARAGSAHFSPQQHGDEAEFDEGFRAWRDRNGPERDSDYRRWRAATGQPFSETFLRWAAEEDARRSSDKAPPDAQGSA